MDLFNFGHLSYVMKKIAENNPTQRKALMRLRSTLKEMMLLQFPVQTMSALIAQRLESLLDQFCDLATRRLKNSIYATEFACLFNGEVTQSQHRYQETFVIPHFAQAPRSATEWEMVNQQLIANSSFIEPEIKAAREAWLMKMDEAVKVPLVDQEAYLDAAREGHFEQFPRLKEIQNIVNRRENHDYNAIIELMSVMPYAAYNLRQFAIEQGVNFNELFTDQLQAERVSILSRQTRVLEKLSMDQFSGECFAKKKSAHGLISDGERYLWIAQEQSPLIQLYTIGHELIHAAQIKEVMQMEVEAIKGGALENARFLNYYGNFLSLAANTLETHQLDFTHLRKPLYGLADQINKQSLSTAINEVMRALGKSEARYEEVLSRYGSLFGYMMPVSNVVKVKALREVVPALENAKNIIYAKECGLKIILDEVRSALPTANKFQIHRYRDFIIKAAKSFTLDHEALRLIASHQYYGVMFPRADEQLQNLTIHSDPGPITLNTGYNQNQQ